MVGYLRHRVTLETPTTVPDGEGGFTETWAVLGLRIPAAVEPATARELERVAANTVTTTASHLVTIRYLPGVTTKTRVTFHDGPTNRILSIEGTHDDEERHRMLILQCTEAVS
jgi:SPP1 family predicted phage head-tail adaptor